MGTSGQRRPSRSPRSQRSRSADVDSLKKYTERRVEERRHTDVPDANKLDPSRWIPLPKTIAVKISGQQQQLTKDEEKRSEGVEEPIAETSRKLSASTTRRMSPTQEEEGEAIEGKLDPRPGPASRQGRSQSADVGRAKPSDTVTEERDPRTIATRLTEHIFYVKKRAPP